MTRALVGCLLVCGAPLAASACVEPEGCGEGPCVAAALATGTAPNDVRLTRCGAQPAVLVPASFDARVDAIALSGEPLGSVFLGVGSNPWAIAGEGDEAWATLFGSHEIALLDACGSRERGRLVVSELIDVSPPVQLRQPADVDGDGAPESVVTRMRPRTPQAAVARGGDAWVTFTNLLEASTRADEPPAFGPGVLARLRVREDGPAMARLVVLPCVNPQGLALDGPRVWVSCSGPLGPDADGRHGALADGALLALDADTLALSHVIDAGRFAPATPAVIDGTVAVGSLVTPRVALVSTDATSLAAARVVELPGAEVDSVFEIVRARGRLHAPVFSLDRVFPIDPVAPPASLALDDGLHVGAGGSAPRGLLALDVRDDMPVWLVALLALSAEVVPVAADTEPNP